jgi:hypothetical protein
MKKSKSMKGVKESKGCLDLLARINASIIGKTYLADHESIAPGTHPTFNMYDSSDFTLPITSEATEKPRCVLWPSAFL